MDVSQSNKRPLTPLMMLFCVSVCTRVRVCMCAPVCVSCPWLLACLYGGQNLTPMRCPLILHFILLRWFLSPSLQFPGLACLAEQQTMGILQSAGIMGVYAMPGLFA